MQQKTVLALYMKIQASLFQGYLNKHIILSMFLQGVVNSAYLSQSENKARDNGVRRPTTEQRPASTAMSMVNHRLQRQASDADVDERNTVFKPEQADSSLDLSHGSVNNSTSLPPVMLSTKQLSRPISNEAYNINDNRCTEINNRK